MDQFQKVLAMMKFVKIKELVIFSNIGPRDVGIPLPFPPEIRKELFFSKRRFVFHIDGSMSYFGTNGVMSSNDVVEVLNLKPSKKYIQVAYYLLLDLCEERIIKTTLKNGADLDLNRLLLLKFNKLDFLL